MMKRNDGYTLAYVVVVLGVMATVALATMALALLPQKNQHLALERMQEKYAAQGYVEQAVALLEHEVRPLGKISFSTDYTPYTSAKISYDNNTGIITIKAEEGNTKVTAEIELTPQKNTQSQASETDGTPTNVEVIIGYDVIYRSYTTTVEKEEAES